MNRLDAGSIFSQSSPLLRGVFRASCLLASLLLLSGCTEKDDSVRIDVIGDQASMSVTPPAFLQTRNIEQENLVVVVTIDGRTYEGTPADGEDFVLQITRPANSSTTVTVVWLETIDDARVPDGRLPLAFASKLLNVGSESSPATLVFSEFDISQYDLDEDGYDNYTERSSEIADSYADPLIPDSPPVLVNLDVRLALPQALANASAEIREAVDAKAEVNGKDLPLTRENNVWIGKTTVVEETLALLTANFFDTTERRLELAYYEISENVGAGATFSVSADSYDTDSNLDRDAFPNIVEIVNGTDPRDPGDPNGPVADAGADVTITVGATVTLNGSGSSNGSNSTIRTYQWAEDGDVLGTGVSLQVPGLAVGDHEIELTVTDNLGLTGTDTVVVTVTGAPAPNQPPVANAGADVTIASGATVTLNGGGSTDTDGTISTYRWSEGDLPRGSGQSITIIGLSDGPHVITLEVTDDDGAEDTDTVTITVTPAPVENQPPVADAGADRSIESGGRVTLDGSNSTDDGTIVTYQWSDDTGDLGTGETLTLDDLAAGVYVFTLEVTDDDGDSATDTVTITVTAAPVVNQPPVANAGADRTIESGDSVTLDGRGSTDDGTIVTYQWSDGTSDLGEGETLTLDDLAAGVYVFTLEVTDDDGDSATDSVQITVEAATTNPAPTANAGTAETITFGQPVTLDGSGSTDDGTIELFQWSDETGDLGTGETLTLNSLDEGEHVITLEVTDDGGAQDTDTVTITVEAATVDPAPQADAGADQPYDFGEPVTLDGSNSMAAGSIELYQWSDETGDLGTGETLVLNSLGEGEHVITLEVTDDGGAKDTDTVTITVEAATTNPAPVAIAGADQTIGIGESVFLDGSQSSDDVMIASYDWYKDDELLISGVEVEISGLSEGAHEFELLVTDNEGATGKDSVGVTVSDAGEPGDDETPDDIGNPGADGARTSATGEFVTPIRTLA